MIHHDNESLSSRLNSAMPVVHQGCVEQLVGEHKIPGNTHDQAANAAMHSTCISKWPVRRIHASCTSRVCWAAGTEAKDPRQKIQGTIKQHESSYAQHSRIDSRM
jgi:hypothetical protein